jgi:hypothetical protein
MKTQREDTLPWYKQFWPWFIISIPALTIVAAMITITIAVKTDDGLVVDDYYKEGLAINEDKKKIKKAAALQITAELSLDENGLVRAQLPENVSSLPFLMLTLTHPGDASKDLELPLANTGNALFTSKDPLTDTGINWHIVITPPDTDWKLSGRWRPEALETIEIVPSS